MESTVTQTYREVLRSHEIEAGVSRTEEADAALCVVLRSGYTLPNVVFFQWHDSAQTVARFHDLNHEGRRVLVAIEEIAAIHVGYDAEG